MTRSRKWSPGGGSLPQQRRNTLALLQSFVRIMGKNILERFEPCHQHDADFNTMGFETPCHSTYNVRPTSWACSVGCCLVHMKVDTKTERPRATPGGKLGRTLNSLIERSDTIARHQSPPSFRMNSLVGLTTQAIMRETELM